MKYNIRRHCDLLSDLCKMIMIGYTTLCQVRLRHCSRHSSSRTSRILGRPDTRRPPLEFSCGLRHGRPGVCWADCEQGYSKRKIYVPCMELSLDSYRRRRDHDEMGRVEYEAHGTREGVWVKFLRSCMFVWSLEVDHDRSYCLIGERE